MRRPISTYRLQLNAQCGFRQATSLVPYLHALGITDLYTSPFLKAQPGSPHGYDVTDHSKLNPEIGTEEELQALLDALRQHGMGLVLDVVPNHMGIGDESNQWWQDVLENGPSSAYAKYFDIDWTPPKENLINQVLLPILGDQFGKVLEQAQLRLFYDQGAFRVTYYERRFPIAPHSWFAILEPVRDRVRQFVPAEEPQLIELESILTALRNLPSWTDTDPNKIRERQREKEVIKRRLATVVAASDAILSALDEELAALNGRVGEPRSFDRLEALLAQQPYRLCYWRVASDEINYRRFFDVSELAAIRVEEPEVFQAVHARVFQLVQQGIVSGLRIDHPDGLLDPEQYFVDLAAGCRRALQEIGDSQPPVIVVEKILSPDEQLPARWPVHGTTGYDVLNLMNRLYVDPSHAEAFHELWDRLTGEHVRFDDVVYDSKRLILSALMLSELHVLSRRLDRVSEQHRWSRDFTLASLQEALREVIACFPVYRTYIRPGRKLVGEEDRRHVLWAIRAAKRRNPATGESIFDFIGSVLLLETPEGLSEADQQERHLFAMRTQQITGSVMAKGLEDTAFYRTFPLVSLNEVGGDPDCFGISLEEFHRRTQERMSGWSSTLLATSTHDTKRSEDVRARIDALSEMPGEWARAVRRWRRQNQRYLVEIDGSPAPDPAEEYLLYQTLIGVWPLEPLDDAGHAQLVERVQRYMEKALKEAKVHTSWINPHADYDRAVRSFIQAILTRGRGNVFLADMLRIVPRVARVGAVNSLSQALLKIGLPGVADTYQGTELWELSLVDPDNRRPIDFARRVEWLRTLMADAARDRRTALVSQLREHWMDGRIKLYVVARALVCRRDHAELFLQGDYVPLSVTGPQAHRVCAFARRDGAQWACILVPRLCASLLTPTGALSFGQAWRDHAVTLPPEAPRCWRQVLTDRLVEASGQSPTLPLDRLVEELPVALLMSEA